MSPGKRILLHFFSSNGRLPNSVESQSMLLEINNELQAAGVRALDLFIFKRLVERYKQRLKTERYINH
jgi:hypothetical protein